MHPMFKTVPLVDNDMDGRLRNAEPPRCRPDGSLVFDDVQGQALGPLLHVSLHSITLPTPCCQFGRARCGSCICHVGQKDTLSKGECGTWGADGPGNGDTSHINETINEKAVWKGTGLQTCLPNCFHLYCRTVFREIKWKSGKFFYLGAICKPVPFQTANRGKECPSCFHCS